MNSHYLSSRENNTGLSVNERGLSGLPNIGNTCFLNSILQCISNTKPIMEYILTQDYLNDVKDSSKSLLIKQFAELILSMWAEQKSSLNTYSLKSALVHYAPRFSGYSQQDAQEFFRYLLEGLHEETNRVDRRTRSTNNKDQQQKEPSTAEETWQNYLQCDNSKIVDTFGGLLKSTLKCTQCGFSSTVFEPFWDLSLPIPFGTIENEDRKINLKHCLDLFTKEEVLTGNEKPTCSKCKTKQTCTKRILIQKFPQILVIHLKRFSSGGMSRKVDTYIDFPIEDLNMSGYSAGSEQRNVLYNLYGVVNHYGSCQFGHYTAFCKHPFSNQWHRFNDQVVSPLDHINDKSEAYILFYETNK